MKKKLLAIILTAALSCSIFSGLSVPVSASSSTPKTLKKVTLQLAWLVQSEDMGFLVAQEKGYYKDEGIDIKILPGGSNVVPEQTVNAGIANVGVGVTSSLMQYQSKGWGLQVIAQTYQKSGMLFVSKKSSKITKLSDLKGKKIGCWFAGNQYDLYALLGKAKLDKDKDVTIVQQNYTMDQFKNNEVDVAQAMTYNEYGVLHDAGYSSKNLNVISAEKEGIAMLENCIFGKASWMSKNSDTVVRFLKASIKGWIYACKHPAEAAKVAYSINRSESLNHETYMAKEVAKLVKPAGLAYSKIGYLDPKALKRTSDIAVKYGLLKKAANLKECVNATYWKKATA